MLKTMGQQTSSWMSRNMIWSGLAILAFVVLHFIDFWFPEINTKFIQGDWSGMHEGVEGYRYFHELQEKFLSPVRVWCLCVGVCLFSTAFIARIYIGISIHGSYVWKKENITKYR